MKRKRKKIRYRIESNLALQPEFYDEDIPEPELIEQVLAERSLEEYIKQSWKIVERKDPLIWNWHLSAISEHLEAVTRQEIHYLIINIPPRHTKSLITSVFWPTWEWGPRGIPGIRFICSSYFQGLSTRDALKSRRLIQSPWYQRRWGDIFKLTSDQNQKTRYDNDKTGYRIATSVGGVGTGEGGGRICCDDPHNVVKVESDAERESTILWWDESMSTRLDNEETGAYVIIAQRTAHNDLCGHVIEKWREGEIDDLVTLILPWRYEKERELHLQTRTPLEFKDPRTKEDELLDKNRFNESTAKKREGRMTKYARAGQLQQRPSPRGGGMFEIQNFKIIKEKPPEHMIQKTVRYWDKAATEGGGCLTAGVKMHLMKKKWIGPEYIIEHAKFGQWSTAKRNAFMKQQAELDGIVVNIYTETEPGSGGKESAELTIKGLAGYKIEADPVPKTSKPIRAQSYADQVEIQNVAMVKGDWNQEFLDQHEFFPTGSRFKDLVDASSGAFNKLIFGKIKKAGTWRR